jgi:hypothetical protein
MPMKSLVAIFEEWRSGKHQLSSDWFFSRIPAWLKFTKPREK